MKKKIFSLILLSGIIFSNSVFAQIDSIDLKLRALKSDSLKCAYILDVASTIRRPEPKIIPYLRKAIDYGKNSKSLLLYADAIKQMGTNSYFNGLLGNSVIYFQKAAKIYEMLKNYKGLCDCYNRLANHYDYFGEYDKALIENIKLISAARKTETGYRLITGYRQTGIMYLKLNRFDSAYRYLIKALELGNLKRDSKQMAYNFSDFGEYYYRMGETKKAIDYQYKALRYCLEADSCEHPRTLAFQRLSVYYDKSGNYDSALKYINKALLNKRILKQYAISLKIAAQINVNNNRKEKALAYLDTAQSVFQKTRNFSAIGDIYKLFLTIFLDNNNQKKARFYYEKLKAIDDSVKNQYLAHQFDNVNNYFELKRFQTKVDKLAKQNLTFIQRIDKYKIALFYTLVLIVITIVFILLLLHYLKKLRYSYKIIKYQKEELAKQKEEVLVQSEKLQEQTMQLTKYKEHLEDLVRERTKDLIAAKEKAEESDKLKTEFFNNLSHEIRTPLNAIIGFSDFLNSDIDDETKKQYAQIIQNSGKQLLEIISDILEMSRLGTNEIKVNNKTFNLNTLLREVHSVFEHKAKEKNLKLLLTTPLSDDKSEIFSDEVKLKRILSNLISNAIRFTEKGSVETGYSIKNNNLELYVKDTGIGIEPQNLEIIFKRFSQEEKDLSKKAGGLGLGLSIAQKYAELLGGKITVESEKGKGSIFRLTIPFRISEEEFKRTNTLQDTAFDLKETTTILVVEDEYTNFEFLRILLKNASEKIKVIYAGNGKEAVEIFNNNSNNISLIIMDLRMPVMNGFEAAKIIRQINRDVPIIALTAFSTANNIQKAKDTGFNVVVSKPVKKDTFLNIIQKFLSKN